MGEARPWQVAVVVVGLLVLIGSVVYQCTASNDVSLADSVIMVDVSTGELIESRYPKNRPVSFPAEHPETKSKTLMPAVQDPETGRWMVEGRYVSYLKNLGSLGGLEDPESGLVKAGKSPSRRNVFK
ncbi:MAG TPA: hypothetical protein VD971_08075 [Phycisphaerales bacterium]|nr:hypothetical protein [Phycisphaerales bacterium]